MNSDDERNHFSSDSESTMEEDFEDIGMNAAVDHAYHISELEKRNHEFDELCVEMRLFLESGDKKTLLLMISNLSMKIFSRSILDRMCNIAMDMNEFTESEREKIQNVIAEHFQNMETNVEAELWKEVLEEEEQKLSKRKSENPRFRVWIHDKHMATHLEK